MRVRCEYGVLMWIDLRAKDVADHVEYVAEGNPANVAEVRYIVLHIFYSATYTNIVTFICYAVMQLLIVCNLFRNFRNTEFIQYLTSVLNLIHQGSGG